MTRARGPMPTVTYGGTTYKLRSRSTLVPDLDSMESLAARVWLLHNTWPRGYSAAPSPLAGMAGAITLEVK